MIKQLAVTAKRTFGFLWLLSIAYFPSTIASSYGNKDLVCQHLSESRVVEVIPMQDHLRSCGKIVNFDNPVYLLTLESGIRAVFKPASDGELHDCYAEVAAYNANKYMGFDLVPPTVMRTINGQTGSLQLFVETSLDLLASDAFAAVLESADQDDVANLKIFYFVFGQWDTGPHNLLVASVGDAVKLIAIDNAGLCNAQYVRYGDLPFVRIFYNEQFNTDDYGKPFPFDEARWVINPTESQLRELFHDCLSPELIQRLARKKSLRYVLYHDALWLQFHAGDDGFLRSYTTHYPKATMERLKQLTLDDLLSIFKGSAEEPFLAENQIIAILDRRDQILVHYQEMSCAA